MARKIALYLVFMLAVGIVYGSDCELPKAVGNCRGRIRRYTMTKCQPMKENSSFFFDVQSHQCRPFMYTGCGGNGNRFYSREECHFACHYFLKLQPKNW